VEKAFQREIMEKIMPETLCSKFIIVKAGSKIVTSNDDCDVCEFVLLDDLQVTVECDEMYSVEKILVLPQNGETKID